MPDPTFETDRDGLARDPAAVDCLSRTRSAVLNVLVVVGAGIAMSGYALGRHEAGGPPELDLPFPITRRGGMAALLGLVALAYLTLRLGSGREALRPPATRAGRFFAARVAAAVVGAAAVPLGFAVGWAVDPNLEALAPFWVAALGVGFLAIPRGHELDDFDEPIAPAGPADPADGPRRPAE